MNLERNEFPLSAKYDPAWVFENQMGISALWLTEWLCHVGQASSLSRFAG